MIWLQTLHECYMSQEIGNISDNKVFFPTQNNIVFRVT